MFKAILIFCLALTLAQAERNHNDDYINMSNFQFEKIINDLDARLTFFEKHYNGRIEAADEHSELITEALTQNERRLNPLLVLGGHYNKCVLKYNSALPSTVAPKKIIAACKFEASKQLSQLLSSARITRETLNNYMKGTYGQYLESCAEEHEITSANYTGCVTSVTTLAHSFFIFHQKTFAKQLEAASCTAKANIRALLSCIFTEQFRVIRLISETNESIQRCIDGKDECTPCEEFTCSESYDVQINRKSETIRNPFYGREDHQGCVMLNAYKN